MELQISKIARSPKERHVEPQVLGQAFASGEVWAFEAAYRLYAPSLMGAALGVLRDKQAAQDCVHDVLARLWQRENGYRVQRGSLSAFLVVCVRNDAISRARRDANRLRIERTLQPVETYNERWEDPIERMRIERALERLGNEQQRAIEFAYYKHMTHEEIASELSIPIGTVKSRIASALRVLRSLLSSEATI